MRVLPILFSTPMIQAIKEGRKTQTRRAVTKSRSTTSGDWSSLSLDKAFVDGLDADYKYLKAPHLTDGTSHRVYSRYEVGDVLWVREAFCLSVHMNCWNPGDPNEYVYRADDPPLSMTIDDKWKPSIHMPKDAARIWLKVTSVRPERLQNISEKDAIAEGVNPWISISDWNSIKGLNWVIPSPWLENQMAFTFLWYKINGTESWEANPWVWVIEFEVLSLNGKPEHL